MTHQSTIQTTRSPGYDLWRPRVQDYIPSAALVVLMVLAFTSHFKPGGMAAWGVSALTLAEGRYATIPLHMFAHGALLHLAMNSLGLLEIGGLVTTRLGGFPYGWVRFVIAYCLAGLSSMIFYISFHPNGQAPLIGASGAIYGVLGLILGIRLLEDLEGVPLTRLSSAVWSFIPDNAAFLGLIGISATLSSLSARVAWQAHLGGFLLGVSVGPWLLPSSGHPT